MAKEKIYTGYAVVTKDILDDKVFKRGGFGISFDHHDLEKCKRYCYAAHIVVRTFRKVLARSITFKWVYRYPRFYVSSRHCQPWYIQLWWLCIELETQYTNGYDREIVYERKDD